MLDNLLTDGQTNSVARIFGPRVQALEHGKNALRKLRRNADPVIAHAEQPLAAGFLGLHGNRRRLLAAEFDRVLNQILKDLCDLRERSPIRSSSVPRSAGRSTAKFRSAGY